MLQNGWGQGLRSAFERVLQKISQGYTIKSGALAGTRTRIFGFGGQRSIRLNYESTALSDKNSICMSMLKIDLLQLQF